MGRTYFLIITILLALIAHVYCNGCENVFPGTPTFGRNCQFRCHCYNDLNCSESEGCNNGRCKPGWMGPHCQYRNIAQHFKETAQEGENFIQHSDLAVDGNFQTCSETNLALSNGQQFWRVTLDRDYLVVGIKMHISTNDLDNFRSFRIETGPSSSSFPNLCYEQREKPQTSVLEITCYETFKTKNIRVVQLLENVPVRICEFEPYGGREIAFNTPTSQSTTNGAWRSTRAVDGRYPMEGEEPVIEASTCAQTNGQENNPFLFIEFQQTFDIYDMGYYGRHSVPDQSKGFYLALGSSRSNVTDVFHDNVQSSSSTDYSPRQIVLPEKRAAKVVKIGMRPYSGLATLSVCEMTVFGDCSKNKCGWNCEKDCYCDGEVTGQMKIDGICPYGCSGRWTGKDGTCDTECQEDEWGELCNHNCGNCLELPCDITTGQCLQSCNGSWIPPLCTQECKNGSYGLNCLDRCGHCSEGSTCNKETGQCLQGCEPGWQGSRCDIECPAQRFGKGCTRRCYCYNGVDCSKDSGECPAGCSPGYHGEHCDKVCPFGYYGLTCAHVCGKCRDNQTCDHVNGGCINGCKPGFEGALCKHEYNLIESIKETVITSMSSMDSGWDSKRAIDGDIGPDPNTCHCCSSTSNQAIASWKLDLRKKYPLKAIEIYPRINEKHYQQTQDFNITLRNVTKETRVVINNDKVIGDTKPVIINTMNMLAQIIEINRVGKLTICEIMIREGDCPVGHFGDECEEKCHCADGKSCERHTGICSTPVCDVGWTGNACNTKCPAGFYGQHCSLKCGFCMDMLTCDHRTGACENGCLEGYRGCFCVKKCAPGYYGQGCSNECGQCKGDETCDYITGQCSNGCMKGYSKPSCKDKLKGISGSPSTQGKWWVAWISLLLVALLRV